MSIAAIANHQPALPVPSRIGQATAVEQSRAIAEVQAQVIVAQQMPRDVERAVREMNRSVSQKSLAERAFYRYKRGDGQVSGESIVLAKELARCWGNIQYGMAELRRDDTAGESEMMAFAWDVETNARSSTTFIVPHVRDTTKGRKNLVDVRDVYENNANMGSRRQREMIFAVLPGWYIEDAKAGCYDTLSRDESDGATLAERAANAAERFGKIGVKTAQLVQKLGAPQAKWSAADLATLGVIYRSIERGETTKEDEFGGPASAVTTADIPNPPPATPTPPRGAQTGARRRTAGRGSPAQDVPPSPPVDDPGAGEPAGGTERPPARATGGQVGIMQTEFERLGYDVDSADDGQAILRRAARLARTGDLTQLNQLNQHQAAEVIAALKKCSDVVELDELLETGEVPDGQ